MKQIVSIDSDHVKLDSFLKLVGVVMSGGEAKEIIQDGLVTVNGEVEKRRGRKLYRGDLIVFDEAYFFVIEKEETRS